MWQPVSLCTKTSAACNNFSLGRNGDVIQDVGPFKIGDNLPVADQIGELSSGLDRFSARRRFRLKITKVLSVA